YPSSCTAGPFKRVGAMSLATAIDELLAFVPDARPPKCFVLRHELLKRFDELDRKVWVGACQLELEGKLPQQDTPGRVDYYGQTNLPGTRYMGFRVAPAYHLRSWRNVLLALRDLKLDSDQAPGGQAEGAGTGHDPAEGAQVEGAGADGGHGKRAEP